MKNLLYSLTAFICILSMGCIKYHRGDRVELLDGRKAIVRYNSPGYDNIRLIILDNGDVPIYEESLDELYIKRIITKAEKEE